MVVAGGKPAQCTVTDICDGIAQGHDGMKYSLISKELIAAAMEESSLEMRLSLGMKDQNEARRISNKRCIYGLVYQVRNILTNLECCNSDIILKMQPALLYFSLFVEVIVVDRHKLQEDYLDAG